jgi:hypothetical protein
VADQPVILLVSNGLCPQGYLDRMFTTNDRPRVRAIPGRARHIRNKGLADAS